ncbi:alpha/beta fold hydrolase [Novosphingobium sp.]|uniref:alpha/beta fold hydrolase n=1 Tax=Novosphingobium sp. TaxID=1874826 RepID=UPI0027344810|nr:alpha/beta hydrolase [Novosphingobium sp.]MDP3908630.1 alpha/beta hydrolase [Novosphingobium sp.]
MQRQLRINGLMFNVLDEGEGEPVLLVHGFPDDHTVWRKQIPALVAAGYRVIAPDTRGCGQSDMPPQTRDYALGNLVADLIGILDALEIGKVTLVGHDWGAIIAWTLAARHPERVERYAALSVGHPAAYASGPIEQKLKGWYVLMFQLRGIPEWLSKAGNWWFLRKFTAQPEEIGHWIANHRRPGRLTAGINYYRANFSLLLRPDKTSVRMPVLGIYSDGDRYLAAEQMRSSAAYVDAPFRFEIIKGAGHWLQIDAPDRVNALLLAFLKEPVK